MYSRKIVGSQLAGTLPAEAVDLPKLEKFDLADNQLSGTIPIELVRAVTRLKTLTLSFNSFDGTVPSQIGLLSELESLCVQFHLLRLDHHHLIVDQ